MRLLVACPQCKRQYDASGLEIGGQFHCRCGAVLTVHQPHGHDADVVCCSRCGAPRSQGAMSCQYCGADFTLHERDLDTVCPHCLACVSHNAKFCHHCGTRISPEMVAGEDSKLNCPACGNGYTLRSRALGEVSALECNRCAGLWLGTDSFRQLTEKAAVDAKNAEPRGAPQKARAEEAETPPPSATRYRPCAVCGQLMVRQNYGRQSGVIVDVCKYHGVWFDADELPRILEWIRAGGLARVNEEKAREQANEESIRKRITAAGIGRSEQAETASRSQSLAGLALEGLLSLFFRY
jgi:Zn-finger nucleic acid-binding protein